MKPYNSVILMTGGIDSLSGYFWLAKSSQPVYFDLGTKYTQKEINHLKHVRTILNHDIIFDDTLKFLGQFEEGKKAFVPFRNLYLALLAATKYSNTIFICGVKDDVCPDKNEEIFTMWSEMLSKTVGEKIQILSPFWNMTKVDVVKWMNAYHPFVALEEYSLSCYSDQENHCYTCPACLRRNVALYQIGVKLPFENLQLIEEYESKFNDGIYDKNRIKYMSEYFNYLKTQW